ncbi:hypothetical protein QBC39DRAFT_347317 [Podospora conica]|nr:hypothetical protein QBC39DRAFT_347317 [Schizothecium conicum]
MISSRSNISMLFLSFLMLLVGSVSATDASSTTAASTTAASTTAVTTTSAKPAVTTPAAPAKSVTDEVCYEPEEEETSTYKPSVPTTLSKVPGGGSGGSGPAPTDSAPKPSGTLVTSGGRAVVPGLALGLLAAVAVVCCPSMNVHVFGTELN